MKCGDTTYEFELIRGNDVLHTLKFRKQGSNDYDTVSDVMKAVAAYDTNSGETVLYYIVGHFENKKLTTKLYKHTCTENVINPIKQLVENRNRMIQQIYGDWDTYIFVWYD